jgi:hypothetical protein
MPVYIAEKLHVRHHGFGLQSKSKGFHADRIEQQLEFHRSALVEGARSRAEPAFLRLSTKNVLNRGDSAQLNRPRKWAFRASAAAMQRRPAS